MLYNDLMNPEQYLIIVGDDHHVQTHDYHGDSQVRKDESGQLSNPIEIGSDHQLLEPVSRVFEIQVEKSKLEITFYEDVDYIFTIPIGTLRDPEGNRII